MKEWMNDILNERQALENTLCTADFLDGLVNIGEKLADCIVKGNKILLAGNGGSAADAQHFAAELVGRFLEERVAMPAISLCVDPSVISSIGNDYGFEKIYARQVDGLGKAEDILVVISTSGNSHNLVEAVNVARKKQLIVVGLLGNEGGVLKELCDYSLVVPSRNTPRIQEMHTFIVHLLCEIVEGKVVERK